MRPPGRQVCTDHWTTKGDVRKVPGCGAGAQGPGLELETRGPAAEPLQARARVTPFSLPQSHIKKRLFMFRFGDRGTRMNWVHVHNLVQAHVLAAEGLTAIKDYVAVSPLRRPRRPHGSKQVPHPWGFPGSHTVLPTQNGWRHCGARGLGWGWGCLYRLSLAPHSVAGREVVLIPE